MTLSLVVWALSVGARSGSGLGQGGMISLPLSLLRFIAAITVWSLVSTEKGREGSSGCKGRWDPQWHPQVQLLGTRAGSSGSWSQCCKHIQLQWPAAGASVVAGAGCRHVHSGKGCKQLWAH